MIVVRVVFPETLSNGVELRLSFAKRRRTLTNNQYVVWRHSVSAEIRCVDDVSDKTTLHLRFNDYPARGRALMPLMRVARKACAQRIQHISGKEVLLHTMTVVMYTELGTAKNLAAPSSRPVPVHSNSHYKQYDFLAADILEEVNYSSYTSSIAA